MDQFALYYPWFLLVGVTIAVVLGVLSYQARRGERFAFELIRLNECVQFDSMRFLEAGAQALIRAGFRGVVWEVDWYGIPRAGVFGTDSAKNGWQREIATPDIRIRLWIHPGRQPGERKFFAEHLCETYALLLQTDIWIKEGSAACALTEFQRLTLFLGHDVKNLAQFIQIASDQVQVLPPEKEHEFVQQMRATLPLFNERSERIIKVLMQGQAASRSDGKVGLRALVERLARAFDLAPAIEGDADVELPLAALDTIMDNLLRNHAEHAADQLMRVLILPDEKDVRLIFISPLSGSPDLLHLFEPFRSTSARGLGLGLYQARRTARALGGELQATSLRQELCLELRLPRAGL